MRRFDLILAAGLALLGSGALAQGTGLTHWSDDGLGISAQVPLGWDVDTMPGGGVLFTQPGLDSHVAAHVAFRAHADAGTALTSLHDQTLRAHLLEGDTVQSDTIDDKGFDLRSRAAESGMVQWQITKRLSCKGGPVLASLDIRFPSGAADQMQGLLADIPDSLGCK
ncbi:hypothetical protein DL1_13550 [Thioclava dalianensis]|uniref:Uncharacterized protein n=1 Tax=Thioclava dalianensis TaxID=1185766 RepID=A0A074U8G0_9RHOB|nr:hypothetical protein [Thioclava dalianensis]KEP70962.1 hypothetical protein DL1_13550 [Thioclava dalianensis]SFN12104.1 hypothetical protein SAMN05216224_102502 [Thioclava dalianensis]